MKMILAILTSFILLANYLYIIFALIKCDRNYKSILVSITNERIKRLLTTNDGYKCIKKIWLFYIVLDPQKRCEIFSGQNLSNLQKIRKTKKIVSIYLNSIIWTTSSYTSSIRVKFNVIYKSRLENQEKHFHYNWKEEIILSNKLLIFQLALSNCNYCFSEWIH